MKKFYFLICLFWFFSVFNTQSQKITAEQLLFNSSQGREFWIAIPPNEDDRQPIGNTQEIALEIYVTSSKDCWVTMEVPGMNIIKTKKVEAFRITTFSTELGDLNWNLEVRESEEPVGKAIHLVGTQPISVYVLNHRRYTADGYLAIPVSSCGTEYIHLSYYDFHEDLYGGEYRGNGFLILPTQPNTEVFIELKGKGKEIGQTVKGRKIGDKWKVVLNPGEVYCVMGDGATRGQFDLSGSRVVANKPIGFISFHKRTLIPSFDLWNGRNMLCEMIPPVTAWGKKYYTVEFLRKGRGDFFRIIAAKDNTNFTVRWYDAKDGRFLGTRSGILKKSGDFAEFEEVYVPQGQPNTLESIKGTSVWEADKPVLVMQYSYSTDWDNSPEFDPFMILVIPKEQYVPGTVFQTPAEKAQFLDNYFNIIAIGDTNDPANEPIKSLTLDGKPIWQLEPKFVFNRIPGTDLFWAKLMVRPGAHVVKGNTKFGGYIYGFSEADGYGWPAATAFNKVDETDTLPPELYVSENCGVFTLRTTELRNGKPDDDPRQIDQGVNIIELLDGTENFELYFFKEFKNYPPVYDYTFILRVIDKKKPGVAYLQITDRAGNYRLDTFYFHPDIITVKPNPINFGKVRLRTTAEINVEVKNESDTAKVVESIYLMKGGDFSITQGVVPPSIELPIGAVHNLVVSYTPTRESTDPKDFDIDTLVVITTCDTFKIPVIGRGVIPRILVEDWDAGQVPVNSRVCKFQQTGTGLKIQNVGSDTLIINSFENVAEPFSVSQPFYPQLPMVIPPQQTVYLETPCFEPKAEGFFSIDVIFNSNAEGIDSISNWKGVGVRPGPYITNYDWERRRVGSYNEGKVYLKNGGTVKVRVTDIQLGTPSPHFRIKSIEPQPTQTSPVDLMPDTSSSGITQIVITVIYEPQTEFDHENTVVPEFHRDDNIPPGSVVGNLHGYGYLPKLTVSGYEFLPPVLINTQHPDIGRVVIHSTSESADLLVQSVDFVNNTLNEFQWVSAPPTNYIIPRGDSLVLPVRFTPKVINRREAIVRVVSDAAPAPDSITTTDTLVIGYGLEQGLIVDSINYGLVLLCDEPIKEFVIKNISSTSPAVIDSVKLIEGDVANFEVLTSFPVTIPSLNSINVKVQFKPDKVGSYRALIRVYSDVGSDYFVLLQGEGYNVPVTFDLPNYGPEYKLAPGFNVNLRTDVKSNYWRDANITSFEYDIVYRTPDLDLVSIEKGGIIDNTWNIKAEVQKVDENYSKIHVIGSGTNRIQNDGTLANIYILLLLTDSPEITPEIQNVTFHSRDKCVVPVPDKSTIVFNTCVRNLRNVIVSSSQYYIRLDEQTIVDKLAKVAFGIAFDGFTRIEVFNSLGNLVSSLVESDLKAGEYELEFNTNEFASGVYIIRLTNGEFCKSIPFVICP